MIRTLKHLNSIDIAYVVESADLRRDELGRFRREVNECLANELKRPAIEFKIEIYNNQNFGTFIRYVLKKKNAEDVPMKNEEKIVMYHMCEYVSMNGRFGRFGLDS